ncbi:helix-turn-helix domain-containing protein [Campylobacter sp. MOP7]|uniref:helix-turn-helix domain-containing protein n=1 Tax=Campylobacter canis TaxID=3378588 RepID=UPI00387E34A0
MRVLIIGVDENAQKDFKEKTFFNICGKYASCILTDMTSNKDIDGTLTHLELRRYDFVAIQFESKYWKQYLEILKTINSLYENYVKIYFIVNDYCDDWEFRKFKEICDEKYAGLLDVSFNIDIMNESDVCSFLGSKMEFFFNHDLRFHNFSIDVEKHILKIQTSSGMEFTLQIAEDIEFRVLSYCLRHYGETLSLEQILNSITQEPEYFEEALLRKAIAYIKSLFKSVLGKPSLISVKNKDTKRSGYQLQL